MCISRRHTVHSGDDAAMIRLESREVSGGVCVSLGMMVKASKLKSH